MRVPVIVVYNLNWPTIDSRPLDRPASCEEALAFSWIPRAVSCITCAICCIDSAIALVVAVSSSDATAIWLISPVTLLIWFRISRRASPDLAASDRAVPHLVHAVIHG